MTEQKTLTELVLAKVKVTHRHICDLAQGKKKWTMCIPPRPDDSDMLLQSACDLAEELAQALEDAEGALEFYADKDNWDTEHMSPTIWDDGNIDLGNRARTALSTIQQLKDQMIKETK